MNEAELSELKEWLTNEVKLQRYFDKLTNYGFTSLELIKDLTEEDLDAVGIVPAYHRTRLLRFCKNLNDSKDGTLHVNDETSAQTGSNETCNVIIEPSIQDDNSSTIEPQEDNGDFDPPPLPPKKGDQKKTSAPKVPDRESSLPRVPQVSPLTGISYNPPTMISETPKKPPPIPRRADLESQDQNGTEKTNGDTQVVDTNITTTQNNATSVTGIANESDPDSEILCSPETVISPKPKPKPRRIPSAKILHDENGESTSQKDDESHLKTDVHVDTSTPTCQSGDGNLPELPQKLSTKPPPRPKPRLPPNRPSSVAVQPKSFDSDSINPKGGSLSRYPMPQFTPVSSIAPTEDSNTDTGTYEVISQVTQPNNADIDDIYDSVDDVKQPQEGFGKVEMRKPQKPPSIFKGVLGEEAKVRVSMYGMIGYDYSDESEDDVLVTDPPFKPRGDSVDSLSDGRPVSILPTTKSRKTSGYLYKQGGQQNNKGWRKRWFVFDGKSLRYYRNEENTSESLHIIPVSQMVQIEYDTKDNGRARFHLVTKNRVFMLASDSITDANLWAQTLMEAIIKQPESEDNEPGSNMSEPDKEGWLKKQGHNVMGDWKKRYVAIKGQYICYYDTYDDFRHETPIHCIMAQLASVKSESHRSRFHIRTPNKDFSFQAENEFEAGSWISAIEDAIQFALSDRSVIDKVNANPANEKCADCGKKDPVWAAVNYCICLCKKCCGIHRSLGVRFSKPRSLLMDQKIWNDQLIELMLKIGNKNANLLLEHKLPEDDRITPESNVEKRMEFIQAKYKDKRYSKISQDYGDPVALGKSLQETVVTDDIMKTMELLINNAAVKFVDPESEDQRIPLERAKDAGQDLQVELLRQNFGDAADDEPQHVEKPSQAPSLPAIEISPSPAEILEKSGFLIMKKRLWFTLKDRSLKFYRASGDKEPSGVIDLRTVTSLEMSDNDGKALDIIAAEKTYTLRGDTDEELDSWYLSIKNKQVFNVHLRFQELGSDGIPHLVANCLQFVETYGLQQEGIYRVNGNQAKIKALRQLFNQDASRVILTLEDYSVHDVTGTLKKYLRDLPEPVFPDNLYKTFIFLSRCPDHNTKLTGIKDTLSQLPKVNYDTLKRVIGHLTKVIADQPVNRMGIENVSMIFGPTLMSNDNTGGMDDQSINQEFTLIGEMIHYYQWLFDVNDEEIEKDKRMEDAMKKITQLREGSAGPSTQEFTLDIKVEEKDDAKSCLLKVSDAMTAGELCMNIVSQKRLQPENNWALFEVIEKLNIERALQFREKVLPVVMSWDVFGEHGKDNYLIVKENHILESIQPFVGNSLALEGQLHLREPKKKDWKLSTVVLQNGKLVMDKTKSFFKSIKSDKSDADQWSLHSLLVYVGVPTEKPQKNIDTNAGFTVVVKNDPELGTMTKYLCARDRTEMFKWVAAILNMKHPEGLWNDPTTQRVRDRQMYLGRQSNYLRRQGSSKHIVEEIKHRQKSLRRSTARPTS